MNSSLAGPWSNMRLTRTKQNQNAEDGSDGWDVAQAEAFQDRCAFDIRLNSIPPW